MTISLTGYYNRFDAQWNYEDILFRPAGLQSAELNEIQALQANRLKQVADALFSDGDVIRGTPPAINATTGVTICPSSVVYINGIMRNVPTRTFTIPITGPVLIGVYLLSAVVEEDDTGVGEPDLRDPAVGTRNYQEPGAARLRETPTWGHDQEGLQGVFYPVWSVLDGALQGLTPPDGGMFLDLLARYDRESNGGYIVRGLSVTAIEAGVFSVREGVANIFGYKIDKGATTRLAFPVDPDLESVTSEPDVYVNASTNIQLNRYPVSSISEVICTKEKTVTITRGGSSGGSDSMPNVSVVSIQSVTQTPTTYTNPANYLLVGDAVSWSPGGAEPAPGSTYSVTYRYLTAVTPGTVDLVAGTFRVTGAVAGALILTDYEWKLPRFDRICISRNGSFSRIKGIPNRYAPTPPRVPQELLYLATVYQDWAGTPTVSNDGQRAILFTEIENMRSLILNLYDLVAQERLLRDIASREPSTKRGVFVDPFLDNDMRDLGRSQNAALVNSSLVLPLIVDPIILPSANNQQDWMLPYDEEPILQQLLETGQSLINPYGNFDRPPARVRIIPESDQWVITDSLDGLGAGDGEQIADTIQWAEGFSEVDAGTGSVQWAIGATLLYPPPGTTKAPGKGRWFHPHTVQQDVIGARPESSETPSTLRSIQISFSGSLFAPGEVLSQVAFSGVTVTTTPTTVTANGSGNISGTFIIPAGIPLGRHAVTFTGNGGSTAVASFFGAIVVDRECQSPAVDPLAQTFTLDQGRYITSVDIAFRAKGSSSNHVIVEIRDVELGIPTTTTVASGAIAGGSLNITGWTRITFDRPFYAQAEQEYCLVLSTDDDTHAVGIAEMGQYDTTAAQWVTAQSYTIGTLLKSSNASTWTPFQEADLTFRLNGAAFTANTRTVELGPVYRVAVQSITRSGATATVTAAAHGVTSGQTIVLSGAVQDEYTGAFVATVGANPDVLTITVSGTPATPATGTIVFAPGLTSDLALLATVERPTGDCGVEFIVKNDDGSKFRVAANAYIELAARIVSGVSIDAVLTGTATASPYLFRGVQVLMGDMQESATYISRAFPTGSTPKVVTTFDQLIPSAASVTVDLEEGDLGWLRVTQDSTTELGDGWLEATHAEAAFADSGTKSRVRLTITGTPASRPQLMNLRVVTI